MIQTLVLNKSGMPINVVPWFKAMSKCYNEVTLPTGETVKKAIAIAWHEEEFLKKIGYSFLLPSVIQLTYSEYMPTKFVKTVPFNRKNVFLRDNGKCLYCGKQVTLSTFTFDHVIPRKLGGKSGWLNVVVSCERCNNRKGGKTAEQAGMVLIRKPFTPTLNKAAPKEIINKIGARIPYKTWLDWIYWNIELEE